MTIKRLQENIAYAPNSGPIPRPGPFIARVVGHLDATYMGRLEVELLRVVGNDGLEGQLCQVSYLNPFYGVTSDKYLSDKTNDYANTQKAYGMWFVPPDPGTLVMVIFVDGDPKNGYWMGCVMDDSMNFTLPGLASTSNVVEGGGRLPVGEYNKEATQTCPADPTKAKKPKHPFAKVLEKQGLIKDDTRGITTSSARREVPSMVFGVSTPGPIDKTSTGKMANIGPKATPQMAPVSRLGGATLVLDDGDDKWLRKTDASKGPPEYAHAEGRESGGQPDIPHNELVRIRTRTGHQILLHNSEDLIYIGNAKGTTWIELTSNGKIDIYAKDSISIHTENDLNIKADRDINLDAGRNINLNAKGKLSGTVVGDLNLKVDGNGAITLAKDLNLKAANVKVTTSAAFSVGAGSNITQSAPVINVNAGSAPAASDAVATPKPVRVPLVEPWWGHENLDPLSYLPAKTEATVAGPKEAAPKFFKEYTTKYDTFNKEQGTT